MEFIEHNVIITTGFGFYEEEQYEIENKNNEGDFNEIKRNVS